MAELWIRIWALTALGGGLVGLVVPIGAALVALARGDLVEARELAALGLVIGMFGAIIGIAFGLVAGAVVSPVLARALVATSGPKQVRLTGRLAGITVGALFDVVVVTWMDWWWRDLSWALALPVFFGWLLAPLLVRWYIREMEVER